jgi:hypothetical protein
MDVLRIASDLLAGWYRRKDLSVNCCVTYFVLIIGVVKACADVVGQEKIDKDERQRELGPCAVRQYEEDASNEMIL